MICTKYLIILNVFVLTLVGCSNLREEITDILPDKIYANAQQKLKVGNWKQAITQLEMLSNLYPSGPCSQQIQLDLIYAYYRNADLPLVVNTIDQFIRFNPIHPNIDYVIYMRGLTNMTLDNNILQKFFRIDYFDRDPRHAREAFNDFSKLIHNYPKSQYVVDATKRLIFLKNRLAKHEYSVANHYTSRGAWVGVINRIEGMLRDYPDVQITHDSLKLMENAYRKMQMNVQADKVAKIITANSRNI